MTNAHAIDYFVITAADLTAILVAWLVGKGWIKKTIKWQRSGNLYWLSSDLMWTWMQVDRGNVKRMNHGIQKAVHHATSVGVGAPILTRLTALQLVMAGKQSLNTSEKETLIRELDEIISQVGKLAESNQGDFKADPEP